MLIAAPGPSFDVAQLERAMTQALTATGAHPLAIGVTVVDSIPAGAGGKRPLVVAGPTRQPTDPDIDRGL